MLNVDWFNLFIHNIYLVGVVYLTILNLPRALRFKRENIILYGLIPGRSEPLLNINTYLEPLVKDFLVLWKGVLLNTKNYSKESFREVLVNVSLDVGRKVFDFLSHNANFGGSKCFNSYSTGRFGVMNYFGFVRKLWKVHINAKHRQFVDIILKTKTKAEKGKLESIHGMEYGCHFSVVSRSTIF